jgi:hypothetical protein
MADGILKSLLSPVEWALSLVRGPSQPALGCLSNEDIDRILSQEDPGREPQE